MGVESRGPGGNLPEEGATILSFWRDGSGPDAEMDRAWVSKGAQPHNAQP